MNDDEKASAISATLVLAANPHVENIWVKPLDGKDYEVLTVPFWAYNLARKDVVECGPDEDGIGLFVNRVVKSSGHHTLRIVFMTPKGLSDPEALGLLAFFQEEKLVFELFKPRMISVDIPDQATYDSVVARLEAMPKTAEVIWEDGAPNPRKNLDGSEIVKG